MPVPERLPTQMLDNPIGCLLGGSALVIVWVVFLYIVCLCAG